MISTRKRGLVRFGLIPVKVQDCALPTWNASRLCTLLDDPTYGFPAMFAKWSGGNLGVTLGLIAGPNAGWWSSSLTAAQVAGFNITQAVSFAVSLTVNPGIYDHYVAIYNAKVGTNCDGTNISGFIDEPTPIAQPGESRFAYCRTCDAMIDVTGSATACRTPGEAHDLSQSGSYRMIRAWAPIPGATRLSRCNKCRCVVKQDTSISGACAATGAHSVDADAWTPGSMPDQQAGWALCTRCDTLVFAPSAGAGVCPMGAGGHRPGEQFGVSKIATTRLTWIAHEALHAVGLGHSRGVGVLGSGASQTAGDYGDPTDIMSAEAVQNHRVVLADELCNAGPSLSLAARFQQGWLPQTSIRVVSLAHGQSMDQSVAPLSSSSATTPALVVVVGPDAVYAIEQRRREAEDSGLTRQSVQLRRFGNRYTAGQPGWRRCLHCQAIAFGGGHACNAGGVHQLDTTDLGLAWDPDATGPLGWRWCSRCNALHRANPAKTCALGGTHLTSGSGNYAPRQDPGGAWAECTTCGALYRYSASARGPCTDPYGHTPGSARYSLDRPGQSGWRECLRCRAVVHGGSLRCPSPSGVHQLEDSPIGIEQAADLGPTHEAGWRWCRKCNVLFSAVAGTSCPAGASHDGSESGNYVVPYSRILASGAWSVCTACGAYFGTGASATCPSTGGAHAASGQYWFGEEPRSSATESVAQTSWYSGTSGWAQCTTCAGLYLPSPDGTNQGVCVGGIPHSPSTRRYRVLDERRRALGQEWSGWGGRARCSQCRTLVDQGITGVCPAGGTHTATLEGGAPIPYSALPNALSRWSRCTTCGALAHADNGAGRCGSGSGGHTLVGAYYPDAYVRDFVRFIAEGDSTGVTLRGEPYGNPSDNRLTGALEVDIVSYGTAQSALKLRMK
jgi:hypothetical protein